MRWSGVAHDRLVDAIRVVDALVAEHGLEARALLLLLFLNRRLLLLLLLLLLGDVDVRDHVRFDDERAHPERIILDVGRSSRRRYRQDGHAQDVGEAVGRAVIEVDELRDRGELGAAVERVASLPLGRSTPTRRVDLVVLDVAVVAQVDAVLDIMSAAAVAAGDGSHHKLAVDQARLGEQLAGRLSLHVHAKPRLRLVQVGEHPALVLVAVAAARLRQLAPQLLLRLAQQRTLLLLLLLLLLSTVFVDEDGHVSVLGNVSVDLVVDELVELGVVDEQVADGLRVRRPLARYERPRDQAVELALMVPDELDRSGELVALVDAHRAVVVVVTVVIVVVVVLAIDAIVVDGAAVADGQSVRAALGHELAQQEEAVAFAALLQHQVGLLAQQAAEEERARQRRRVLLRLR